MPSQTLRVANTKGEELAAVLDTPDGEIRAFAIFAHCFACTKDLNATVRISRALAAQGYGVLRFDFTGIGQSGGEFSETSVTSTVDDLLCAADFLRKNDRAPDLLVGHSIGGAAVILAAATGELPELRAVATIGAPSSTEHLRGTLEQVAPGAAGVAARDGVAEMKIGGRVLRLGRALVDDLDHESVLAAAGRLKKPLLIFHSPIDATVGIENASALFQAAKHPKSFVSIDGADHLLLERATDSSFVANVLASWAARYLEIPNTTETDSATRPALSEGQVQVHTGRSGYTTDVWTESHHLIADEPVFVGGANLGPSPYGYLLAALGACTGITLRMYANHKKWPLESVDVVLEHRRIHVEDCDDCDTKAGLVSEIARTLTFAGNLDDEQRARLVEIADRCPVHRTLSHELKVRTELV